MIAPILDSRTNNTAIEAKPPLKSPSCSSWLPRELPIEVCFEKMLENTKKTLKEHSVKNLSACYAKHEDVIANISNKDPVTKTPLSFSFTSSETQGRRSAMEDAHFCIELEDGILSGVFDGHGGSGVANFANAVFPKYFPESLHKANGNVHQAFEEIMHRIHQEIAKRDDFRKLLTVGTTAVVSFVDKKSHLVYTATLGDSESTIYRRYEKDLKVIPLACIRDWSSPKDALRVAIAHNQPEIATEWPTIKKSKYLRVAADEILYSGSNVSRAIGDWEIVEKNKKPMVIHKPKITVNKLQPGDYLVLGSDGLKDYVSEEEMIMEFYRHSSDKDADLSNIFVNYALNKRSTDNITVIVIKVEGVPSAETDAPLLKNEP